MTKNVTQPTTAIADVVNCAQGASGPVKAGGAVVGPCQPDAPFALLAETQTKVDGGATIWARQTIDSDIFLTKPDKWFKIWFYIINKVKFMDNGRFKRGENFIKYAWIEGATGATKNQVDMFIRWAKETQMLTTQKTTRGMIVKVLKYGIYQDLDTYKNDTRNETLTKHKRNINDTILKNDKNDKKEKEETPVRLPLLSTGQFQEFWETYPKKEGKKKSEDIWIRKNLDSVLPDILAFIEKAKQTRRWQGGFIQAPTTFLNGETWNDDVAAYGNGNLSSDPIMNKAVEIAAKAKADWPNDPDQARLDSINRLCEHLGIGDSDPDRFVKTEKYHKIIGY